MPLRRYVNFRNVSYIFFIFAARDVTLLHFRFFYIRQLYSLESDNTSITRSFPFCYVTTQQFSKWRANERRKRDVSSWFGRTSVAQRSVAPLACVRPSSVSSSVQHVYELLPRSDCLRHWHVHPRHLCHGSTGTMGRKFHVRKPTRSARRYHHQPRNTGVRLATTVCVLMMWAPPRTSEIITSRCCETRIQWPWTFRPWRSGRGLDDGKVRQKSSEHERLGTNFPMNATNSGPMSLVTGK